MLVEKKSGKPFQNGEKVAEVTTFTIMVIPSAPNLYGVRKLKNVFAVYLKNCEGAVRLSILKIYQGE